MSNIRSVYLAQAVDLRDDRSKAIKDIVKEALLALNVATFDPATAFQANPSVFMDFDEKTPISEYIFGVNLFAFVHADIRIFVSTGATSWGMPMELYWTVKKGLPFIFLDFTRSTALPVYVMEMFSMSSASRTPRDPENSMEDFVNALRGKLPEEANEFVRVWSTPYKENKHEPEN